MFLQLLSFLTIITQQKNKFEPPIEMVVFTVFLAVIVAIGVLYFLFLLFEHTYGTFYFKPLIVHFHLLKKKLPKNQKRILETEFSFYKKLSSKHKRVFEHRVYCFIKNKDFVAREEIVINNRMKVLISATAIMLTFGFRKYLISTITTLVIYPDEYYSSFNDDYHKGEFNPRLGALVLSWKHFLEGYNNENDNINLGIHEMMHAIHLNSMRQTDISAFIFKKKHAQLTDYLALNESIRVNLINNDYFRDYAFTNQYEFLAVIVENFIETPNDFKRQFPIIYNKIKGMLNFCFPGY